MGICLPLSYMIISSPFQGANEACLQVMAHRSRQLLRSYLPYQMTSLKGPTTCRGACVLGALHLIIIHSDRKYQRILEQVLHVVTYTEVRNSIVLSRILALLGCKLNVYPAKQ